MSSVTRSSVVIRVLPAVGLALLLTAPASSFGDGMRGMLPWGGKKDYQPLEAGEKADQSADESVEESEEQSAERSKSGAGTKRPAARPGAPAAGTSGAAAPAKRSSWSPFGRTAGSGSEPAASPAADAQKKPGLFRNPFRREPVKPADPFAGGNAAESEESAESEEQEEAADAGRKTASGSRVVKSAAGPAVRPVVGRGAKEMQAAEAAAEQDIEFMAGADDESS
ncbi:MAG: hypothetical protein ACKPHU_24615, partial [Planctomycetaceae bacterium]